METPNPEPSVISHTEENSENDGIAEAKLVNRLGLTSNYNFYRRYPSQAIYTNVQLPWKDRDSGKDVKGGLVNWTVTRYVYATGAPLFVRDAQGNSVKNPNFKANGGQILFIFVHGGTFEVEEVKGTHIEYLCNISFLAGAAVPARVQLPRANTWVKEGNNYRHTIQYDNRLSMFKNGANENENVDISYEETYAYQNLMQGVETRDVYNIGFNLKSDTSVPRYTKYPLHGLSTFETDEVTDTYRFWLEFGIRGTYSTSPWTVQKSGGYVHLPVELNDLNNLG